jgi:alkylation response protein AidB-like acyl-CoA dehydrogenase
MDFNDTPEQADFRRAASSWLDRHLRDFSHAPTGREREEQSRRWQETLYRDGWIGISWPKEYGGQGHTAVHEAIFNEEAAQRGAPMPINVIGISLAGPAIMVHGTQSQKQRYLPRILNAEEIWCQGFSEPGAGSDLASLRTRAVREGGLWRVDGRKIWTSWAHCARKCLLLTRTDPSASKHAGITCLMADTDRFDVRPIVMINGDSEFNEVLIEDVAVPDSDRLGAEGDGWAVALTTLAFERSAAGLTLQVMAQQVLDRLVAEVRSSGCDEDTLVLDQIGRFEAQVLALRVSAIRGMSAVAAGLEPGPETSGVKLIWARTIQRMTRFAIQHGLAGDVRALDPRADYWLNRSLRALAHSIEGGTDEVQKSIIAERVLGLPRSR